jgi:carbonic anhydrase/acetyltransferase-like protein (isoleucine patch superfamily)
MGKVMQLVSHHGVTPKVHASVFVASGACLVGEVEVGGDSSIWYNAVLRADINRVTVGCRSNIQDGSVLHVTHELPVLIADDVTVGHKAMLHGCTVLDCSLIGMNAVVLDRARIGPYAVVAAGSVVREGFVVPEGKLVAGVPARVVRDLTEEERKHLVQSARNYVEYARSYGE